MLRRPECVIDRPLRMDPFAAVVSLLRPRTVFSKLVRAGGKWGVRYTRVETAGFGLVLAGECYVSVQGGAPLRLSRGDFVLVPPTPEFSIASDLDGELALVDASESPAATETRHGDPQGEVDFELLGGYFRFETANAELLVGLLPVMVHIQGADVTAKRLVNTIELLADEALGERPGRNLIVERLVEVMLVEALRFRPQRVEPAFRPGLLEGMADRNLARALRRMHTDVAHPWTVADLAREAGHSRSAFSERFIRTVGLPPMEYLMQWRMALAKDLLAREPMPLEAVAAAIGYQSASAFSTAFRRQVGQAPAEFRRTVRARGHQDAAVNAV